MRNILVYIFINCAFIGVLAKYDRYLPKKEHSTFTREYFEEEARKDAEDLLSVAGNKQNSNEDENDDSSETMNVAYTPHNGNTETEVLINNIEEIIKHIQTDKHDTSPLIIHHRIKHLGDDIENQSDLNNPVGTNRFIQLMKRLAFAKNALRNREGSTNNGKYSFNKKYLRYGVDDAVPQPEKRPELKISKDKLNIRTHETSDEDEQIDLDNTYKEHEVDLTKKQKNDEKERIKTISNNLETLYKLSKQLKHLRDIHDSIKKQVNSKTNSNLLKNSKSFEPENDNLYTRQRFVNMLRRKLKEKQHSSTKENLRNLHKAEKQQSVFGRKGDAQDVPANRLKRSAFTQAGYTQDPDTCKTYNDNLAQLWSNLSKYINVTEQPNDKALHNIAIIIQAYLEHQNARQSPDTYKVRHGARDKIGEVIVKIRRLIDDEEGTADKITKTITKNLIPYYGNSDNEDCEQVNEESLSFSIDLLYKNYLENIVECPDEEDVIARNKVLTLRKQSGKDMVINKPSLVNSDDKPEIKTILIEDELYNDYHKGKMPRQRAKTNKNRRVLKQHRKHRSRPINRSENENVDDNDRPKERSKSARKFTTKKLKKSSLKTDLVKSRCEKYATRKLIVSLRPVIERFMGLQECQLDNTLRSLDFDQVPRNHHYYLYASKFFPEEDSQHHNKNAGRSKSTRKNTEQNINKSRLEVLRSQDKMHETDKDMFRYDGKSSTHSQPWVRKYRLSQTTNIDSATPTIVKDTDSRESQSDTSKAHINHEYNTHYNEYFQSPPLYDDYDGTFKAHHANAFPSMVNPLISLNDEDKTNVRAKSTDELLTSPGKGKAISNLGDVDDLYYEEGFLDIPNISEKVKEMSPAEYPFVDLTKLKSDDYAIETKSRIHTNNFESITDFLKKARDASLQTPEFALPFALNTNKGYVELTHLVKYPKILVYRPQFIVKNTMPYDDFLKTINNFNMTNDQVRLMKIVRHMPDNSVKVLFETEDFESPLEVRDLVENRRSGSSDAFMAYQLQNEIDEANTNTNAEFTNKESKEFAHNPAFSTFFRGNVDGEVDQSDSYGSKEYSSPRLELNSKTYSLSSSESNHTPIVSRSSLPSLGSGFMSKIPSFDTIKSMGSGINSISNLGSGLSSGLSSLSNLGSGLGSISSLSSSFNSVANSKLGSGINTLSSALQDSASESYNSKPIVNSYLSKLNPLTSILSDSNSVPHLPIKVLGIDKEITPSSKSSLLPWWKTWKDKVMKEVKKILGTVDSLGDKINHVTKGVA